MPAKRGSGAPEPALRLLGLAARAGGVVPGTARVREAARAGAVRFVVIAADASSNTKDKLIPLLRARRIRHTVAFRRDSLGMAVGRAPLGAVGVTEARLADRLDEMISEGQEGAEAKDG